MTPPWEGAFLELQNYLRPPFAHEVVDGPQSLIVNVWRPTRDVADLLGILTGGSGSCFESWLARDAGEYLEGADAVERAVVDGVDQFTLRKRAGTLVVFATLTTYLSAADALDAGVRHVVVGEDLSTIETRALSLRTAGKSISGQSLPPEPPLRRLFTRATSDQAWRVLPRDVHRWILADPSETDVPPAWLSAAAQRLTPCFADEVASEDGHLIAVLQGPRRIKMILGAPDVASRCSPSTIQAVASWIFVDGTDADVRHHLLVQELARLSVGCEHWEELLAVQLADAFAGAQSAYRAHLMRLSESTVKTLSELRRQLNAEREKLATSIRDVRSALARDMVVALVGLSARLIPLYTSDAGGAGLIGRGVALFALAILVLSWVVAFRSSDESVASSEVAFESWRSKLFAVLDDDDYAKLVTEPLSRERAAYDCLRDWVAVGYSVMVSALVLAVMIPEPSVGP